MEIPAAEPRVHISQIRFRHFKALKDFTLDLSSTNVLVGPNNTGKSTIIGALRVLAAGLTTARAFKAQRLDVRGSVVWAHPIPDASIPISLENVHTDYETSNSTIDFQLSNGNSLRLLFDVDGRVLLHPTAAGYPVIGTTHLRRLFPITVAVVPVLGPVEHNEERVALNTVKAGLSTHRASRHFRNYWHYFPDGFEGFRRRMQSTWEGMDILPPEVIQERDILAMWVQEHRVQRELFWAGTGFQVWCQLLTHVDRAQSATILAVDEPEIYLHADLQRQLLSLLRGSGPDIVIATHSSEIIGDSDAGEIAIVDKSRLSAWRPRAPRMIGAALAAVGSVHPLTVVRASQTRRVLVVEGDDFKLMSRLARTCGMVGLSAARDLAVVSYGGTPTVDGIRALVAGLKAMVPDGLEVAGVFDSDLRADDEITSMTQSFAQHLSFVHIWARHEIENYYLVPDAIDKAIQGELARRSAKPVVGSRPYGHALVPEVVTAMRKDTLASFLDHRVRHRTRGVSERTATAAAIDAFETLWSDLPERLYMVGGKEALAGLNSRLEAWHLSITTAQIATAMGSGDVPIEMRNVLKRLETFRRTTHPRGEQHAN